MFLLLLSFHCSPIEQIYFSQKKHPFKLNSQVIAMNDLIDRCLFTTPIDKDETLMKFAGKNVFMMRMKNEPIGLAFIVKNEYYDAINDGGKLFVTMEKVKKVDVLELYCVCIHEKYRGGGLCKILLESALKNAISDYKVGGDAILALHINAKDKMMGNTFAVYVCYGFTWCTPCLYGPDDLKYNLFQIKKLDHPVKVAIDIIEGRIKAKYVAMYMKLADFRKQKRVFAMEDLIKIGNMLQKTILKNRSEND